MSKTQRRSTVGIIQKLLDEPYQFEFMQAIRLLEKMLVQHGIPRSAVLTDHLQFRNSTSQSFPPSEIESLTVCGDSVAVADEELLDALIAGERRYFSITPAFIGLLGNHGVLPSHYTEHIATHEHRYHDEAPRAYVDLFSNRMIALYYQAWCKHRLELPRGDDGDDGILPLLLSLSGRGAGPVPNVVAGYYAAAFRQRPVSAAMIERVLNEHFGIPIKVIPSLGQWHMLAPDQTTQLGKGNTQLGAGAVLGPRLWRRDLAVELRLGPLGKTQHQHFLKDAPGAVAMKQMLSMFNTPTVQFVVQLVLQAEDVQPTQLDGCARLGMSSIIQTEPVAADRELMRYLIKIE